MPNPKADREEALRSAAVKAASVKGLYSKASRSPLRPLTATRRIGETITVGELANKMAVKGSGHQSDDEAGRHGHHQPKSSTVKTSTLVAVQMGHKVILRRENELEEAVYERPVIPALRLNRAHRL